MEPRFRVLLVSDYPNQPIEIDCLLRQARLPAECLERATSLTDAVGRAADGQIGAILFDLSTFNAQGLAGLIRLQSIAPGVPILAYAHQGDAQPLEQSDAVTCLRRAARKRSKDLRLVHAATHDRLTGLANRWLLEDRLKRAVGRARRSGLAGCIYYLDLDDFKCVNDRLGHEAGDQILQALGQRLIRSLRDTDTAARLGGDEFVIVMDKIVDHAHAERVRARLQRLLAPVYAVGGREVSVIASIGLALFPGDGSDLDSLLRIADLAMYRDKRDRASQAAV